MPPLNCIISISLELYRRSWECFAKREQQSDWGTVQWPDENATRGVVGPSPQRCPWSQWSRILDFGRAFEVCLSETWQRLQATGQRRQELMFKPGLHLWIGMDSFFCSGYNELPVSFSSLQLLHLIITAVYGKVWFASCIHILPKTTRKKMTYHGLQPFTFYHHLK